MGYPMAGHLKTKGGHEVTVYNRTAAKAEAWVGRHGGRRAATPKEAAAGQDFVMACVGNDDDLRAVTLAADGAFAGMKNGAVFIDHTTASAEIARELFAGAKKRGFDFSRCTGVRRAGGSRKWRAYRNVRRRDRALFARRADDRCLCAHVQAYRGIRQRPAHQDGQPDLHGRLGYGTCDSLVYLIRLMKQLWPQLFTLRFSCRP
jgi:hypothetical protein